jgi:hypothetical protein
MQAKPKALLNRCTAFAASFVYYVQKFVEKNVRDWKKMENYL